MPEQAWSASPKIRVTYIEATAIPAFPSLCLRSPSPGPARAIISLRVTNLRSPSSQWHLLSLAILLKTHLPDVEARRRCELWLLSLRSKWWPFDIPGTSPTLKWPERVAVSLLQSVPASMPQGCGMFVLHRKFKNAIALSLASFVPLEINMSVAFPITHL